MKKLYLLLLTGMSLLYLFSSAQQPEENKLQPYYGKPGVKKKISELNAVQSEKNAQRKEAKVPYMVPFEFKLNHINDKKRPINSDSDRQGPSMEQENKVDQNNSNAAVVLPRNTQTIWSNFLASTFDEGLIWPADPNGAAGKDQLMVLANTGIKVFDKRRVINPPLVSSTGNYNIPAKAQLFLPLETFFAPVLTFGNRVTDPHVRYDRLTGRWFVAAIEVESSFSSSNHILLAVSDGDRITDTSSFIYYQIPTSLFPHNARIPYPPFLDFPTLGVDNNSVLIGGRDFFFMDPFNQITDSIYQVGYVMDKKKLTTGQLVVYPFKLGNINVYTGTQTGMYIPQGVQNDDPKATKSFFAGINSTRNGILLAAINYNKSTQPTGFTLFTVPVQPFQFPRDVTAPGSPMPIDPSDTRLLQADIRKNKITGKISLWTSHAIGVSQSGGYISERDFTEKARTASRWYEIDNIYSRPRLNQWGTLFDATQPNGRRAVYYFNPSITANGQGHAVMGGTTSAFNQYLNVFITGRFNDDPSGVLQSPIKATNATAIYAPTSSMNIEESKYVDRWGDFSQTVVDPIDDQTFWTFQEYANMEDKYGVRAVQIKAPPPATPLPLGALSNRADTVVILNAKSINHSGFFDPGTDPGGPGYNRLIIKSSGSIVVTNIKLLNPTRISFRLNIKGKATGTYSLMITNPDGQSVTTTYTITTAPPRPALNARSDQNSLLTVGVYPNPTTGEFRLELNAQTDHTGRILLLDANGKQLQERSYHFVKGSNEVLLSLASYDNGTYIIAVYDTSNQLLTTQTIVKAQ